MPQNCDMNTINSLSSKFSDLKVIAGGVGSFVFSGVDKSASICTIDNQRCDKVAIKRLPLVGKGQCRVALRELFLLRRLQHENVVKTHKITDCNGTTIDDPSLENFRDMDSVYIVEELLDTDLQKVIIKNGSLSLNTAKLFLYQLLRGLKYIHSANVIHRDIKPGNIFVNADDLTLKIGDYGLARVLDERYCHKGYLTAIVSTRYYRAPEVMIDLGNYSYAIDIWSAGCVFAEMLLGKVLFSGENDLDQLNVICSTYGVTVEDMNNDDSSFPQHLFEGFPPEVIDLLSKILCLDPSKRLTADEALRHSFFSDLHDPKDEPICDRPFFIEHEIDNLPVKILKRKILKNSCLMTSLDKKSYNSSEENLFKDFDEVFIRDCSSSSSSLHRSRRLKTHFNSHGEDTESSSTSIESPQPSTHTNVMAPIIIVNNNNNICEDFFPSLKDAMTHEAFIDEPFKDPGVCERKYHELDNTIPVKSSVFTETNETSYFSGLSPVLDMSEPTFPSITSVKFETIKTQTNNNNNSKTKEEHFLGIHGRSGADSEKYSSRHKIRSGKYDHDYNKKSTLLSEKKLKSADFFSENEMESGDIFLEKSKTESEDIRSINNEILRTLNERKDCGLEAFLSGKLSKQAHSRPFAHWGDSLKFWI